MRGRNTTTGTVLENTVIPALRLAGYGVQTQVIIGNRLGQERRKHRVDLIATDINGEKILISLKWQQVYGTAEQKVPFEVICLVHAIQTSGGLYKNGDIDLGGEGFYWRDFYVGGV